MNLFERLFENNPKLDAKKQLSFMVAAPGTGKSTHIKKNFPGAAVVSADHYFENPKTGKYNFDPKKIVDAHGYSQKMAEHHMSSGHPHVVVDNTNTAAWQLKPYLKMAAKHGYSVNMHHLTAPIEDLTAKDSSGKSLRQSHGVPDHAVTAMKKEADTFASRLHSLKDHPTPMKELDKAGEFKAPWEKENDDNSDIHHLKHTIKTFETPTRRKEEEEFTSLFDRLFEGSMSGNRLDRVASSMFKRDGFETKAFKAKSDYQMNKSRARKFERNKKLDNRESI